MNVDQTFTVDSLEKLKDFLKFQYLPHVANMSKDNWKDRPNPLVYCSIEELVLDLGSFFSEKSDRVVQRGLPRQCYKNALDLVMWNRDLIYVEGFAISDPKIMVFPWQHAWAVDGAGKVIDPTWEDGTVYFGVPLKFDYVGQVVATSGMYGVFGENNQDAFIKGIPKKHLVKINGGVP